MRNISINNNDLSRQLLVPQYWSDLNELPGSASLINILPMISSSHPITHDQIRQLCPLIHLLTTIEYSINGNINNLLGTIGLPLINHHIAHQTTKDVFINLYVKDQLIIISVLYHTINWFKTIINAFVPYVFDNNNNNNDNNNETSQARLAMRLLQIISVTTEYETLIPLIADNIQAEQIIGLPVQYACHQDATRQSVSRLYANKSQQNSSKSNAQAAKSKKKTAKSGDDSTHSHHLLIHSFKRILRPFHVSVCRLLRLPLNLQATAASLTSLQQPIDRRRVKITRSNNKRTSNRRRASSDDAEAESPDENDNDDAGGDEDDDEAPVNLNERSSCGISNGLYIAVAATDPTVLKAELCIASFKLLLDEMIQQMSVVMNVRTPPFLAGHQASFDTAHLNQFTPDSLLKEYTPVLPALRGHVYAISKYLNDRLSLSQEQMMMKKTACHKSRSHNAVSV